VSAPRLSARALWGLASWALPLAVIFVVTPFLLRALGTERFGVLMICLVMPLLATQLDFGITTLAVRQLSSQLAAGKVDAGRTLATFAGALGVIGLMLGGIVWVAAGPLAEWLGFSAALGKSDAVRLVQWCALWIAVSLLTAMPGILARSAQAFVLITAIQTINTALLWFAALAVARSGGPLHEVVVTGVALAVGAAAFAMIALRRRVDWRARPGFDLSILRSEARFSAGMFVSQLASAVVYQGDRIMISAVGSPAIAGIYALCANVANKVLAAVVALTSFAFPHATALHASGSRERVAEFVEALDRGVIAIVAPLILPGVMLAQPFFALWLGEQGTPEVAMVFRILWVAFAMPALSVSIASAVAAQGNSALPARFAALTAVVIVFAIGALVPRWGAAGGATAMLLALATSLLFRVAARRALALPPPSGRARFRLGIALGLACQLAVLLAGMQASSWLQLIAVAVAAIAVFYGVRAIFGLLSPEERNLLHRLVRSRARADIS
jgi:O-antigen/teichoic acid export membrane protein